MYMQEYFIVFPEGDIQEVSRRLPFNTFVDVNGNELPLPLPTNRMIVFRVSRISTKEQKGGTETYHFLELVAAEELKAYARHNH